MFLRLMKMAMGLTLKLLVSQIGVLESEKAVQMVDVIHMVMKTVKGGILFMPIQRMSHRNNHGNHKCGIVLGVDQPQGPET